MGGDFAPENNIAGVKLALESGYAVDRYLLVGQTDLLVASLKACGLSPDHEKLEIVHSDSVVDMCESPTIALRKKKDSSIAVAARLVKDGLADGVVSAGNTGAAVASMVVHTRMAAGIERPAIASVFPGPEGFFTVLDIGANVECKPIHLAQYAILGETYTKVVLGIKSPRIGLLNIGEEDDKGNELARATRKMLASMPINFVGNIEGSDLFFDKADVVVCDGFVGNIVLKTCEGMAKSLIGSLKMSLNKTTIRKAGAWLSKNAFVELKEILDHEEYGGAPLMGTNGICIIAHGSSSPRAICNAIRISTDMVNSGFNQLIGDRSSLIDWTTLTDA